MMAASSHHETADSGEVFEDHEFNKNNAGITDDWISIKQLYSAGVNQPLLPEAFSREQFGQGNHYECFMISALATLIRFPDVIRNCFVTKKVRQDGRYTFQFFRGQEWVRVEIDDRIAMEEGEVLYVRSPTEHWWPLLLEKAYAKFYTAYDHLEGCTLLETFHDLTGNPVLNIPMDAKLAKAAGVNTKDGPYWLSMGEGLLRGDYVLSALTKDSELESIGMQSEQQYAILGIFSLTGASALDDIVIHLHNPFEDDEYEYSGPLNKKDSKWPAKLRQQYPVDDRYSIFIPLKLLLKSLNSIQYCLMRTVEAVSQTYRAAWKGESAGGNPTSVLWRKNPFFLVRNSGPTDIKIVTMVQQEDHRRFSDPDSDATYVQCGVVVTRFTYQHPIPTFYVTGNSHKTSFKGLFLNSREVANVIMIPAHSMCYLVPSCMHKGAEASFQLSLYHFKDQDYSQLSVEQLAIPGMNWASPATKDIELCHKKKDRVDFYVDEGTDIHILVHQTKPYVSKSGGDAMTEDYMGMYLYDDTDRKIAGVHAATNFRETSIIHRLPRSGRYAISITCPRGTGHIPANVTIVSSFGSHIRRVNAPADATVLPDEAESVADSEDVDTRAARIDYNPFQEPLVDVCEHPDSNVPFEDREFMLSNRDATSEAWVHIGDLYPEGKAKPLLPDELSRDQFGQGAMYECCCLTGFATLIENHPDVIRNCFISKKPRKDGRYTFQFHRYGQWIKVEIDDRIPMVKGDTVFCRSPTHHWWPLLLEKAYAKFYTRYENLAGCSLGEMYHDFTGCPVMNTPLDELTATSVGLDITSPVYWVGLRDELRTTALAAQCGDNTESLGLAPHQFYGVLDILPTSSPPRTLSEVVVQLHNPFVEIYTGPMSDPADPRWASREMLHCHATQNTIFVPVDVFLRSFCTIAQAHLRGLMEPCWNFHSEWGDGTNGGNPSLLTWRENPLYIVRNTRSEAVEVIGMIRQPDKRHQLHVLPELSYVRCDLLLAQSMETDSIPTYLVTHNNHRVVHKRVFLNYREVASKIRVPPQSQCYLVPTAMYHEKSIFLLSYWFRTPADEGAVSIERLRVNVARDLPAVKHFTLAPEGKDRVDFFVDVPTDAHILLSQWNRDARGGSDVRTDNYVGMYLYDDATQAVAQVSAASNLKEISLVTHLPAHGHYVLSITCPAARDEEVKCRVEIVCVEMARVRITDVYENPPSSDELEEEPPLALVDSDTARGDARNGTQSVEAAVETRPPANTEAEEMEKTPSLSFMCPRYRGILTEDLPLMEAPAFAKMAEEREQLKRHASQHAAHINSLENKMEDMATRMADDMHDQERAFLGPEVEGVPLELLPLCEDDKFIGLEHEVRVAMKDLQRNGGDVVALRETLEERAREMARKVKESERNLFLNPMPLGISCDDLPLDTDPEFHALEVARLRERLEESYDEAKIRKLNDSLNDRAEDLATAKLAADRQYLNPEHLRVAVEELPLNENRNFILKEALRQEKLKNSRECVAAIATLESELNKMAKGMAAEMLAKQRPSYLAPEHHGRRIEDLPLNDNDDFIEKERRRRDLLKQPSTDMDAVAAFESELNTMADAMARAMNAAERQQYMKASYYDKTLSELPLNTDPIITRLEAQRARLKRDPVRNAEAVYTTEAAIICRAETLARAMISDERARLYGKPSGVPVNLLDLDDDQVIRRLEEERIKLLKMPNTDPCAIVSNEEKLKARAAKIAEDFRDNMRAQITGEVRRSPSVMSISSDAPCQDLEEKLYALMSEDPIANEDQISDIKDAVRKRHAELKRQAVLVLRAFLDEKPFGIPLTEVGHDNDPEYMESEEKLKKGLLNKLPAAQITSIQEGMQNRVNELAVEELARRYPFINTRPADITLAELPVVGTDQPFWKAIDNFEKAKAHHTTTTSELNAYEKSVNKRLDEIAQATKWKAREDFLDSRPGNVPVKVIPLDNDPPFVALETKRRISIQSGTDLNSKEIHSLENDLRTRAHDLACEKKWVDRDRVLDPRPEGVPLRCIPLDEDAEFVALEDQWRDLLRDPGENAKLIADVEERMTSRAQWLGETVYRRDEDADLEEYEDYVKLGTPELCDGDDHNTGDATVSFSAVNGRHLEKASFEELLGKEVDGVPIVLLNLDEDSVFWKRNREYRNSDRLGPDRGRISRLEEEMLDRAYALARRFKDATRKVIVGELMSQMAEGGAELDSDEMFLALERELHNLEACDPYGNSGRRAALEEMMRQRASVLAKPLLHIDNRGFPLDKLSEQSNGGLSPKRPGGGQQGRSSADIKQGELGMDKMRCHIADGAVADDPYLFFGTEVYGVPVDRIPLRGDEVFRGLAEERRRVTSHPEEYSAGYQEEVEAAMRRRVEELADEYKSDHLEHTAARDGLPKKPAKPNGAPKESGSGSRRPRAKKKLKEVEERTEEHRLETVEEAAPFTDPPFHNANKQVADTWPRIADVYPEGLTQPLLPDYPKTSDMASSSGDLTYLAPFLAALSRQPPLLHRLFQTKMHPVCAPYRFVFFDPNSAPVTVEIDDRIPCDVNGVPRFTVSPNGAWWPLLVERAYAKYVGGYERLDQCTSHETLRDLTGRPVTHLPLDAKLSAEVLGCNYRDVAFWRRIHEQLERGDVFLAASGDLVPDGIHPHCYYAVFDVIETVPGSNDPSDVVVKIHNSYHDAPQYHGPLAMGDSDWTPILRSVCKADPENEPEFLYLPQPVFLRNFSSMQRCHINCGDRLTVSGEWTHDCSGGSPTYTTFRQNPMYLLQNNSNRNVTVLAELRHSAPVYYDAHNMGVYHLTALALLRPDRNAQLVAPLLAHNTHKFVQKGLLTDAREVCAEMELPANSTCYLIPYTKKKACFGKYHLSVYPQDNPVNLTTLRPIAETHNCMAKDVVVLPCSGTSVRVDIRVSEPCDVHALLHQNKVTDPTAMRRGDHLAEDEIFMAAYENNALLVCSTGDASNAREHSIAFQAAKAGRYTFLIGCPSKPVSGDAPCTLIIYTPRFVQASFASVNESTRSRVPPRVQSVNAATTTASARLGSWQSQAPQSSAPVSNGAVHTPRGNPRNREYSQ